MTGAKGSKLQPTWSFSKILLKHSACSRIISNVCVVGEHDSAKYKSRCREKEPFPFFGFRGVSFS